LVIEIVLDGRLLSTQFIADESADERTLKRRALEAALAAGDIQPSQALRAILRVVGPLQTTAR